MMTALGLCLIVIDWFERHPFVTLGLCLSIGFFVLVSAASAVIMNAQQAQIAQLRSDILDLENKVSELER